MSQISSPAFSAGRANSSERNRHLPMRAVVFDLDGVLVDSRPVMKIAFTESFYEHCGRSMAPPIEEFFRRMGRPFPDILRELGLPAEMSATFRQISRNNMAAVTVCDGVRELLDEVRERGFAVALMTGKDRERTVELLKFLNLLDYFEWIVCGDDSFPGKPAPDGLNWIIEKFGVRSRETALIGDSALDIECAVSAAVVPLGAGWGVCSAEELLQAGAWSVFESPLAFSKWIRQSVLMAAFAAR